MWKLHCPRTQRLWCLCVASVAKIIQPSCVGKIITKQRALEMCKHCDSNGKGLIAATTTLQCQEELRHWLRGSYRANVLYIKLHITYESTIDSKKKERKRRDWKHPSLSFWCCMECQAKTCFSSFGESDHNPLFQEWYCLPSSCAVLVLAIFVLRKTLKSTCYVKGSEKKGINETKLLSLD